MSTATEDPLPTLHVIGISVVIIILYAIFSKSSNKDDETKGGKKREGTASSGTSKKSKKKKSKSKAAAAAAEAKPSAEEATEKALPESASQTVTTSKKKKKKSKKKASASGDVNGSSPSDSANATPSLRAPVDDDDDSDDDVDLWRIQSAAKRKGANDAAKRAAANKERDRERRQQALEKREEEKAAAAAAEKARKEKEEAEAAAAKAAAEEEAKLKAAKEAEEKAKKNGSSNGGTDGTTGEKKKRKRKKKKPVDDDVAPVKKPSAPQVERWETVPVVEEWQEVNTKRSKQKAKMEAAAAAALEAAADEAIPGLSDEPIVEEPGETSVSIPAGNDPLIFIGKGGSTIQSLQENSGAKFHLNRTTNILTISGLEDCVQSGLAEAQSILAAEAERKANEATEKVSWGSDAIKAVIGKGGSNIRSAQEKTGVRIDADVDAGTLVIVGPRDQVAEALTLCHNAAFGEAQDVLELGSRNAVNVIYGPGFQTIRELQDSTGCKLEIARGSTTLKLSGSNEAVADAAARVRALLESNRGFEMTIENTKVGAVYGKGGETVRSIQDRTGVQIDVVRGPTHATVSVMGTQEASERARLMLQRAIDGEIELGPGEVAEEIELGSATAAVIGRGGSNVADLEKRHGVKINVRSELRTARVVGRQEKVSAAGKDILAIVTPILEAEQAQKKADEAVASGESAWQVDSAVDDADGW